MLLKINDVESLHEAFQVANFGDWILTIGLILTLALFLVTCAGIALRDERFVHAARQGQFLVFALMTIAGAALLTMIFGDMYVSSYVYRVTEVHETFFFKLTGLWASQEGSLLFWCMILSFCGSVFAFANRHTKVDRRFPYALAVLFAVQAFFLALVWWESWDVFQSSSPFTERIAWLVDDRWAQMTAREMVDLIRTGEMTEAKGAAITEILLTLRGAEIDSTGAIIVDQAGMPIFDTVRESTLTMQQVYEIARSNAGELPAATQQVLLNMHADGNGLNPQLHNYWIAIHPPTLYIGYIGFTIPFCYGVGALLSGDLGPTWIRKARVWTMLAWSFLTAGIAMGGLWAYEILGWGGYWAWDPVENASFIPWLTATAFIHSAIVQERRGILKVWNVMLIILTFCMTILGTFLVRSGIIESVHAFGNTGLGVPLKVFFGIVFVGSILLVFFRMPALKAERKLETLISREGAFLLNNFVLLAIAAITVTMTMWPALTEYLFGEGERFQFRPNAYNFFMIPLFLLLLFLTGCGPLLSYGRNSLATMKRQFKWPLLVGLIFGLPVWIVLFIGDFVYPMPAGEGISALISANDLDGTMDWGVAFNYRLTQFLLPPIVGLIIGSVAQELLLAAKLRCRTGTKSWPGACLAAILANRRRFGGYIAHVGIAMLAAGIAFSSMHDVDTSAQLSPGEFTLLADDWAIVFDNPRETERYRLLREYDDYLAAAENPAAPNNENARIRVSSVERFKADPEATPASEIDLMGIPPEQVNERMMEGLSWSYRVAEAIRSDKPSIAFEAYEATIRIFPYQPQEISHEELAKFDAAYAKAFETRLTEAGNVDLQTLIGVCSEIGPEYEVLLRERLDREVSDIDTHRRFQRLVRNRIAEALRFSAFELIVKARGGDADAEQQLDSMSFMALPGLRYAESQGGDVAEFARERLRHVLGNADTVRPRIQMFYDKQTGRLRAAGESVRDPAIQKYLTQDVYLILQDVRFGKVGADVCNFRIFIKPGMNLGIFGLIVVVLGALFALLPAQRPRTVSYSPEV